MDDLQFEDLDMEGGEKEKKLNESRTPLNDEQEIAGGSDDEEIPVDDE